MPITHVILDKSRSDSQTTLMGFPDENENNKNDMRHKIRYPDVRFNIVLNLIF